MKMNKKKQRGAAAIEYAILAAAMTMILFKFVGNEGDLTKAIHGAYEGVITKLGTLQEKS